MIVVTKHNGAIGWYGGDPEFWIFDQKRWVDAFVGGGHDVDATDFPDRFGLPAVDEKAAAEFLAKMAESIVRERGAWEGGANGDRTAVSSDIRPLLLAHACQVEESEYRVVARGQYAVVYESNRLDGEVCPGAAVEVDRQVKDLATALRVEVPDDFKVVARVEPDEATVKALCDNPSSSGCAQRTADGDSLLITAQYLLGHETVHAVQRLRESRAHRALREGEAAMLADWPTVSAVWTTA